MVLQRVGTLSIRYCSIGAHPVPVQESTHSISILVPSGQESLDLATVLSGYLNGLVEYPNSRDSAAYKEQVPERRHNPFLLA